MMATNPCYIHAASAISPQLSFAPESFLLPLQTSAGNQLYVQDAPYREYISPVAIRRMSRMLKFSISAAIKAWRDAGEPALDGILTGTGNGSITDMQSFLMDMITLKEETLNPTAFIQSTFNSPNGWIAMQTKCEGYNQCFLHRGISFELALLDAQMLLSEAEGPQHLLAGCYDELTELYYIIKDKIGYWKKENIASERLFHHNDTPGTIAGEGAAFFVLSNQPENALAQIKGLAILEENLSPAALSERLHTFLADNGLQAADIQLVLTGANGDSRNNAFYEAACAALPAAGVAGFKHLCGEYDTATGFGLWASVQLLQEGTVPEVMCLKDPTEEVRQILILNKAIRGGITMIAVGR